MFLGTSQKSMFDFLIFLICIPLSPCVPEITKDSSGSVSGPDFSDSEIESVPSAISSTSNISGMVSGGKQPSPMPPSPITPQENFFVPVEIDPVTGRPKEPRTPIRPGRMNSSDAGIDTVESHDHSNQKYGRDMDNRDGYRDDQGKGGQRGSQNTSQGSISGPNRPDGAPGDSPASDRLNRPVGGRERDIITPDRDRSFDRGDNRQHRYDNPDAGKPPGRPYDDNYTTLEDNNEITPRKIRDDIPDSDLIDYEDDGEGESLLDGSELEYDESTVRIFIALFDYDPMSQSPNPDAADEELPFKEGQLIKVFSREIVFSVLSKSVILSKESNLRWRLIHKSNIGKVEKLATWL